MLECEWLESCAEKGGFAEISEFVRTWCAVPKWNENRWRSVPQREDFGDDSKRLLLILVTTSF